MGLMTSGTAARRGGKSPREIGRAAGAVTGDSGAVSQNICKEYSTLLHHIIQYSAAPYNTVLCCTI